jgi:hypothetical protein
MPEGPELTIYILRKTIYLTVFVNLWFIFTRSRLNWHDICMITTATGITAIDTELGSVTTELEK